MNALQQQLVAAQRAREARDYATARQIYHQCLDFAPRSGEIGLQIALCSLALREPHEALKYVRGAATPAQKGRAALIESRAHRDLGDLDATHDALEKALDYPDLAPELTQTAARTLAELKLNSFGDPTGASLVLSSHSRVLGDGVAQEGQLIAWLYTGECSRKTLVREVREHAQQFIAAPAATSSPTAHSPHPTTRRGTTQRRLRIGVISPSLHATPVGFLTLGALTVLRDEAELIFFDRRSKKDWVSESFQHIAHEWHSVEGVGSAELYDRLCQQRLDALIDCGGWTDIEALRAISRRPAPKQFKWVGGQSFTTGLDCFDGFLADTWQVPKACESLYTEPVLRFKSSYITYYPPEYFDYFEAQRITAKYALRTRDRIYAIASNPAKISAKTIAFLETLKPKKLILIDHRWRFKQTRHQLEAALRAVTPNLEFLTPMGHLAYLRTLRDTAATFVDTTPYSMGLSAIELLLMGKDIISPPIPPVGIMAERHSFGHRKTRQFDEYESQAQQLLAWCRD